MLKWCLITLIFLLLPFSSAFSEGDPPVTDYLPATLRVATWLDDTAILDWSDNQVQGLLADEFQLIGQQVGIDISLAYLPAGRMSAEFKKGFKYDAALYLIAALGTDHERHLGGRELYQGALVGTQSLLNIHMGLIAVKGGHCDASSPDLSRAKVGLLRAPPEVKPLIRKLFNIDGELIYFTTFRTGVAQLLSKRLDCILAPTAVLQLPGTAGYKHELFIREQYPPLSIVVAVSALKNKHNAEQILQVIEAAIISFRQAELPAFISRYELQGHAF